MYLELLAKHEKKKNETCLGTRWEYCKRALRTKRPICKWMSPFSPHKLLQVHIDKNAAAVLLLCHIYCSYLHSKR